MLRGSVERLAYGERLVELRDRLVRTGRLKVLRRRFPRCRSELVDAEPAGQLAEPGSNRVVVAQLLELLVRPREDLLEHVLGVVVAEPEGLDRDRVHIARKALDQFVPGGLVTGAAPGDEGGICEL